MSVEEFQLELSLQMEELIKQDLIIHKINEEKRLLDLKNETEKQEIAKQKQLDEENRLKELAIKTARDNEIKQHVDAAVNICKQQMKNVYDAEKQQLINSHNAEKQKIKTNYDAEKQQMINLCNADKEKIHSSYYAEENKYQNCTMSSCSSCKNLKCKNDCYKKGYYKCQFRQVYSGMNTAKIDYCHCR